MAQLSMQNTGVGACDKGKIKHSETIALAESLPFLCNGNDSISASVHPIAGSTGKIQSTTSTRAQIEAGTAIWADWTPGVVAADATAIIDSPVTALKLVKSTGATIAWDLVG